MKGIVTKYLNQRIEQPSVNAKNPAFYKPGTEVEIVDIVNGDEYDGNKVWYKLDNGVYVWSGGVEGIKNINLADSNNKEQIKVTLGEFEGRGKGIGVAVLDSGVNKKHTYVGSRVVQYDSLLASGSFSNIHPHGHKICGIITSNDPTIERNLSDLYCYRVSGEYNDVHDYAVLNALRNIISSGIHSKIDLINMSIDISDDTYVQLLQIEVDKLNSLGVVSIVSAGENFAFNKIARLSNVIKIGIFNLSNITDLTKKGKPKQFDSFFLDTKIITYSPFGEDLDDSINKDSAYTAYVTSVVARLLSQEIIPKNKDRISYVSSYVKSLNSEFTEPFEPFKFY